MRLFGLLCLTSIICFFHFSWGAPLADGLELNAKNTEYEEGLVHLSGDVKVKFGNDVISCDKATFNMKKQEIIAVGNVRLESDNNYLEGEKITYNYKTKLGEIHKGFVQAGNVVFMGDLIKKNSEKNFVATKARYTSCNTCPAAWSFSGSEIEAEMGGYASIKYPILRVADFPVFILPRIWVPLKSDRQSGVLVPSLENSSRGGTAITLPYFWAISRSQDLTYSLKSYEKRGLKHLAEYRYVLSDNSKGFLNAGYLKDENFIDRGNIVTNKSYNRGFMSYEHYYELPNNFVHRANLNLATDLRYARDFSEEMSGHGDPAFENKFSVTKNSHYHHFNTEVDYYTNLLKSDPEADNSDAVHRMPEVMYSFMEQEIFDTNLFFKFDFDYTNFARRDFSYDDVTISGTSRVPSNSHDGTFDYDVGALKTDQIRTGHRFIFQPTMSYPFHLGQFLDVNPAVTYNVTEYRFNTDPAQDPLPNNEKYDRTAQRNYVQTDISFKTKYSAVYGGDPNDLKATKYKHEIEPEIIHSRIPYADRPSHIFFGNFEDQSYTRHNEALSDDDFLGDSGVQFDYRDRLFDKNIATFILNNHLIRKVFLGDTPSYQRFLTFRLAQSYDFNEAKREDPHPWSTINGLLDVRQEHFETHTTADYYPYASVTNWSTRLKFISDIKNYLELTYSKNIIVSESQDRTNQVTETWGTGVGFRTKYLDLVGRTNFSLITEKLESWEYVSSIKPPGDCWSIKFGHKRNLGADTVFKFSLNFDFGGT